MNGNSTLILSDINEVDEAIIEFTPFIWPPTMFQNVGMLVLSFLTILGTAGGMGGAGINIPMMMIFFDLPIKECVPLANMFGFLAALIRFLINFNEKHPNNAQRTTIDYEIVTLSMPMLYLGTLFGVRVGSVMSHDEVLVSLMCVLLYVIVTSFRKGL